MASIHKHPRSPFYHAAYIDADGARVSRSTKQTKRGNAWRVAIAYEDATRAARHGNATAAQMRKVITETLRSVSSEAVVLHTIADWCNAWVADKIKSKADGTGKRYGPEMKEFLAHLGPKANKDLSQLTKLDVQGNRDRKTAAGLANASANLPVKMLRTCLGLAVKQGLITTNPAMAVDLLSTEETNKRPLTRAEVARIIAASPDDEWVGMNKVGYYVGPRISNAAGIQHGEIDYD
jgi:integrase